MPKLLVSRGDRERERERERGGGGGGGGDQGSRNWNKRRDIS